MSTSFWVLLMIKPALNISKCPNCTWPAGLCNFGKILKYCSWVLQTTCQWPPLSGFNIIVINTRHLIDCSPHDVMTPLLPESFSWFLFYSNSPHFFSILIHLIILVLSEKLKHLNKKKNLKRILVVVVSRRPKENGPI
jgi:hypothetical protein